NAARHVEQHEAADLFIRATQAARQLGQQRPRHGRRRFDPLSEILTAQHEEMRILHRDHVGGTRPVVDERELPEMLAHPEYAEDDFAPILADEYDLHAPLTNDEEGIARVVLEQNHAAARIELLARQLGETFELDAIESGEERDRGEEVGGGCLQDRTGLRET